MGKSTCTVVEDGVRCTRPGPYRRGMCNMHHLRVKAHGDPLKVLPNGRFTDFNREAVDYFLLFAMAPTDGCRSWPFDSDDQGYGRLSHGGGHLRVHALICEAWHGPRPDGLEACHNCGNAWCWAGEHLRWDTRAGNLADRVGHGTMTRGSRAGSSKLTEADIPVIRQRLAAGELQGTIAADYGVGRRAIGRIGDGTRWGWLD